jgi:ribonuclease P protein component
MFPQKNRLKKKKDFEEVFQSGDTFFGRFFLIKIKKNELGILRFAFVFPIKIEKKANKRNRTKRVFREATRSLFPLTKEGFDIIFIMKKEAEDKNYEEIRGEIEKVFKNIKLI